MWRDMRRIIECVPNFSEGIRPEIYNAIADAIKDVPGCYVLDVSANQDHNRTVITFVGDPQAVEEGAFQAIKEAAQLINLNEHKGEHPRIGATDVCPLIPVKGVTEEECVSIANRLGKRVGEELEVTVYLYGAAAKVPERKLLSAIRRGEYEKWREEVETVAHRKPDYGPAIAKPWGATVIGVRPFLIAYNIYLNTDDVDAAKKIAKSVRFSSGGLRHVQAMGFLVDGQAQVSMNLTDFNRTPIHLAQEMVRSEASRYGLSISRSELVGLAPQNALFDAAEWYLQQDDFSEDQVLEVRIAQEVEEDIKPHAFIEATASGTPTPGGGSVAALSGALGIALTQMVANLTVGRKKYADVDDQALEIVRQAEVLKHELTRAIQADSDAFEGVMDAYRNRSLGEEARHKAIEQATILAGEVPMSVARMSKEVASLAKEVTKIGNINAITDAAAGGIMASAAVEIAGLNVRINAKDLKNTQLTSQWLEELERIQGEVSEMLIEIRTIVAERGGI
jgi:glutamate formiminotransferase/formiminotetrahydrofolate cyclodeaminase